MNLFLVVYFQTEISSCVLQVLGQTSSEEDDFGKFYFYLAFENSICNDYVTEKFFRGLQVTIKTLKCLNV